MSNEKSGFFEGLVVALLGLYSLSVSFFALYFNYLYAKEYGFIEWLFFGGIIATLKAMVWPFFI